MFTLNLKNAYIIIKSVYILIYNRIYIMYNRLNFIKELFINYT